MKKKIFNRYVDSYHKTQGVCVNTGEFGDGSMPWKGVGFSIRDDIDNYENVESWEEDSGLVTHYVYRDFADGGSPDVIRGEFALFYPGHSTPMTRLMIHNKDVIFVYDVINKKSEGISLSILEKISLYIHSPVL
jgi:hypothetical protein